MRISSLFMAAALLACGTLQKNPAQELLDKIDDRLHYETPNGWLRADLSGLLDLEGYYIDQTPPGLIYSYHDFFFNPRLSLFLDANLGEHLYLFLQTRADRGFDPGSDPDGDIRADEYFLRYTPLKDPVVNLQVGKFATVFGNWVARHDSWQNPFITAPLAYENVMTVSDQVVAPSAVGFAGRRNRDDNKLIWMPVIWGPSYASGASLFGTLDRFDYAAEIKNASLSSRPEAWDATEVGWEHPTVTARLGYRPNASWNVGASASVGSYMLPIADASPNFPAGNSRGDFRQITIGHDISYAWRHWQIWAEAMASRFETVEVGDVDSLVYYVELKRKISTRWFVAARWNQHLFDEVEAPAGQIWRWDDDMWRIDAAIGHRYSRHLQAKLQYSYSRQRGSIQQGEQLIAAQLTVKF